MLPSERHRRIVEKVNADGVVTVRQLADEFQVTQDCIRKDLRILSDKQLLTRIHGGASTRRENIHAYTVRERKDMHVEEKERIVKKAVSIIPDQAVVFLDISTISLLLATEIVKADMNVTVVTNMFDILSLCRRAGFKHLIFIGGELNPNKDGFIGSLSIDMISNFKFDLAFLGVVGINIGQNAVTTYDVNDGLTKKAVMAHARKSYMLCEEEKFHQEGHYSYAAIDDFTGVISDHLKSSQEKALIAKDLEVI